MRIAKIFSLVVAAISVLCFYSYMVYHISIGGEKFGVLTTPVLEFSRFPSTAAKVWKEISGGAASYLKKDNNFSYTNKLDKSIHILNSYWNNEEYRWDIKLQNLKNNEDVHTWSITYDMLGHDFSDRQFPNMEVSHSLMLPNRNIIASNGETSNLFRLDKNSNKVWSNHNYIFHHSINLDAEGFIWTCTSDNFEKSERKFKQVKNFNGFNYNYRDDYITQLDASTGKVVYRKSVMDILLENGYKNFAYGFSDPDHFANDPVHLNDVQPLLSDSKYWNKGDVLVSIRNRSLIFLYRPSTNSIIQLLYGPFINQHDVDVLNDSTISIFNNNCINIEDEKGKELVRVVDELKSSQIITYSFADSTYKVLYKDIFEKEKIGTVTQGLQSFLSNGDVLVESQNQGKVFILNKNGINFKRQFDVDGMDGYVHSPHWIRVYENIDF